MKFEKLLTQLVWAGLWLIAPLFLFSQTPNICDCPYQGNSPVFSLTPDITICEGDTSYLEVSPQQGTIAEFANAATFTFESGNHGALSMFNVGDPQAESLTIGIAADTAIVDGAEREDSLYFLLESGVLAYLDTSGVGFSLDSVEQFNAPVDFIWSGVTYCYTTEKFYSLANHNSGSQSIFFELDLEGDTVIALDTFPNTLDWLTCDPDGTFYGGDSESDQLYTFELTGNFGIVGGYGEDFTACQGADFDLTTGELFGVFTDSLNQSYLGKINTNSGAVCISDTLSTSSGRCPLVISNSNLDPESLSYSWSPSDSMSSTSVYNPFVYPDSSTVYSVTVTDQCGNSGVDSVEVTVVNAPDPLNSQSCISDVNITLGADCEEEIQPSQLLTGNYECPNQFYEVVIDGRPDPIVTGDDVGQTLDVSVQPIGGGNSCWSAVEVKDDLEPTFATCEDVTVAFSETPPAVVAEDNCDPNPTIDTVNIVYDGNISCDSPYIYAATETYIATDSSGNVSQQCERTVYVFPPLVETIEFPDSLSLKTENPILCDTNYAELPSGYPDPSFSGEPAINGIPISNLPTEYQVDASYNDIPMSSQNSCKTSVLRVWNVIQWECNNSDTLATYQQLIEIVDQEGPSFSIPDFDTLTTEGDECTASVTLPYPSNVSDNCSQIDRVTVSYGMNFISDLQPGGATDELPRGTTEVIYVVYDECDKSTSDTTSIVVEDRNEPTVICRSPNVGLNNTGPTRVYASSFDDGSFDDCSLDRLEVARKFPGCDGSDTSFGPYVEFSCCDVGDDVEIILKAIDEAGNENTCETSIEVQDKADPEITAPSDITVSCEYPVDFANLQEFGKVVVTDNINALNNSFLEPDVDSIILTDPGVEPVGPSYYGMDGVVYDNCEVTVEESHTVEDLGCNAMMIERTFRAISHGEALDSATQLVYVQNIAEFSASDITWPKDTMLINTCSGVETHPDNLEPPHDYPQYEEGPCNDVAVSFKDTKFFSLNSNDPACFKILRNWKVMDWCSNSNSGQPVVYEYDQMIKVVNNSAPTFTEPCEELSVCNSGEDCGPGYIELVQGAIDDCTDSTDLQWTYRIDLFDDGSYDHTGFEPDASGEYPVGTHRILWEVENECGNTNQCSQLFTIESCVRPTPICLSGITVELTPMIINGDSTAMAEISADLLNADSRHPCGYDISFSFSSDVNDTTKVLDCDDVGVLELPLYVTDENGRQDFCSTYILVQNNQRYCGSDPGPVFPITGSITSSSAQKPLPNTKLQMEGDLDLVTFTDEQGAFEFPAMEEGGSYTIRPEKNDEILNGVSTFDILLIQQHILGLNQLPSPYQWIAADVDHSGSISGRDLIQLRKVILGLEDEFENNTSWRFVDADYDFGQGDPLKKPFPEAYDISNLDRKMHIGFEPIKVGDVNHSANFRGEKVQPRWDRDWDLYTYNETIEEGKTVRIPVYAGSSEALSGFQMQWHINDRWTSWTGVEPGQLDIGREHFHYSDGTLNMSWTQPQHMTVEEGEPLFYILLRAETRTKVSTSLSLAAMSSLNPEAYLQDQDEPVQMRFSLRTKEEDRVQFVLEQNRPNPATDRTTIRFRLPLSSNAVLTVTDGNGREVMRRKDFYSSGWNEVVLRTDEIGTSGVYYYRLTAGSFSDSKKMILIE